MYNQTPASHTCSDTQACRGSTTLFETWKNGSDFGTPAVCVWEVPKGLFLFRRFSFMTLSCLLSQVCRNLRARHKSKNLVLFASWFRLFEIQPSIYFHTRLLPDRSEEGSGSQSLYLQIFQSPKNWERRSRILLGTASLDDALSESPTNFPSLQKSLVSALYNPKLQGGGQGEELSAHF